MTAWILWGAFLVTLANFSYLVLKVIKVPESPAGPQPGLMIGLACLTGALSLGMRALRARVEPGRDGVIFTRMLLGLALGETVALFGFILHITGSGPRFTMPMIGAAALLHLVQAPVEIGGQAGPRSQPDLPGAPPTTKIL